MYELNKDKRRVAYFRALCKAFRRDPHHVAENTSPISLRRVTSAAPQMKTKFEDTMMDLMPPALRMHLSRKGVCMYNQVLLGRTKKKPTFNRTQRQRSAPARL